MRIWNKSRAWVLSILLLFAVPYAGPIAQASDSTVVIGMNADARSMEPLTTLDQTTDRILFGTMYEPLFYRDYDMNMVPLLASGYRIIDDLTWEVTLKPGIKFHNGETMTAEDVRATFEFIIDPANNSLRKVRIAPIESVEVVDELTVRFHTSEPYPTLLEGLNSIPVLPASLVLAGGPAAFNENPVGTGPYMLKSWNREQNIVFTRFDDYWRGPAEIATVEYRIIPNVRIRLAALMAGEVDLIPDVPPHSIRELEASGVATAKSVAGGRVIFVALDNLNPGPMQDVRVRQAVNHAVDVDLIIDAILEGQATRMAGPLISINTSLDPGLEPYPYDPERARQLLAEAGYPNGIDVVLHTPDGRYLKDRESAEAIAAMLTEAGIRTEVRTQEWGTMLDLVAGFQANDMHFFGRSDIVLEGSIMEQWFIEGAPWVTFRDEEIQEALSRMRTIVDPDVRRQMFYEIQAMVQEKAPWLFLWQQHDIYGVSNRLEWEPKGDEMIHMFDARLRN